QQLQSGVPAAERVAARVRLRPTRVTCVDEFRDPVKRSTAENSNGNDDGDKPGESRCPISDRQHCDDRDSRREKLTTRPRSHYDDETDGEHRESHRPREPLETLQGREHHSAGYAACKARDGERIAFPVVDARAADDEAAIAPFPEREHEDDEEAASQS